MHPIHQDLQCPLTRRRDAGDRQRIATAFPALQACPVPHYLALRRYLDARPEKFYSRPAYELYVDWLQQRDARDRNGLKAYFSDHQSEFDRALMFLREINSEGWHDLVLKTGDPYDLARSVDRLIHPAYLRLVEAVFTPFLRLIAFFLRLDGGKGTDGLGVYNVVQEVERSVAARPLTSSYRHIIRNAIAHGGITFLEWDIRYRDRSGEETCSADEVVNLFDGLLDVCNGFAAALKVFFAMSRPHGYSQPREILVEELQEETSTPWWRIEGCVESGVAGRSQLTFFARPYTRDAGKVNWSAIQTGILAEYFAPGYDRYFLSLRSPKGWPGWAAFDGRMLRDLRQAGAAQLPQYGAVIEQQPVFFISGPSLPPFLARLDTLAMALRLGLGDVLQPIKRNLGIPIIECRHAVAHRNAWGAVVSAEVVVEPLEPDSVMGIVRKHRGRIIRAAIRKARREGNGRAAAYLPIAFAQVGVFRQDFRKRRLSSFGLGEDLICTVRLQRLRRIRCLDIAGSTVESDGSWRIAWNRAWLDSSGATKEGS